MHRVILCSWRQDSRGGVSRDRSQSGKTLRKMEIIFSVDRLNWKKLEVTSKTGNK